MKKLGFTNERYKRLKKERTNNIRLKVKARRSLLKKSEDILVGPATLPMAQNLMQELKIKIYERYQIF